MFVPKTSYLLLLLPLPLNPSIDTNWVICVRQITEILESDQHGKEVQRNRGKISNEGWNGGAITHTIIFTLAIDLGKIGGMLPK